eukprot:1160498-Pelagomonas_calceolata.AAC.14
MHLQRHRGRHLPVHLHPCARGWLLVLAAAVVPVPSCVCVSSCLFLPVYSLDFGQAKISKLSSKWVGDGLLPFVWPLYTVIAMPVPWPASLLSGIIRSTVWVDSSLSDQRSQKRTAESALAALTRLMQGPLVRPLHLFPFFIHSVLFLPRLRLLPA